MIGEAMTERCLNNASSRWSCIIGLVLAIPATALGVALAVYVGWYRAGAPMENVFWMALGIMTVLGTHLLPVRMPIRGKARAATAVIWSGCLGLALYSHATFYLLSLEHAGQKRAEAVHIDQSDQSITGAPPRTLLAIVKERETVSVELAKIQAHACRGSCPWREVRGAALRAKLEILATEETAVKRWQQGRDRATELFRRQKDAARQDLVAAKLSEVLDVSVDDINIAQALLFAVVLEGLACLGWLFVFSFDRAPTVDHGATKVSAVTRETSPEATPAGKPDVTDSDRPHKTSQSVSNSEQSGDWTMQMSGKDTPREIKEAWLETEVRAGRFTPTVMSVREFLGCGQLDARVFTRHLKAVMADASPESVT